MACVSMQNTFTGPLSAYISISTYVHTYIHTNKYICLYAFALSPLVTSSRNTSLILMTIAKIFIKSPFSRIRT